MQSFCKTLFGHLRAAGSNIQEHNALSLNKDNVRQESFIDLPTPMRQEIMNTSSYIIQSVVESNKISDEMQHVVRIIPETGTRIDIYFLTGPHCKTDYNQKRTCNIIEFYVRVLERYAKTKVDNVQIVLLPTKHPKVMDMSHPAVLGPENMNSGVTIRFAVSTYSFIFVYRYEEMFKVLLHELVHLYRFDYHETPELNMKLNKNLIKKYKIESPKVGLNETFTDSMTLLFYIGFFIAIKRPQTMRNIESFTSTYKTYLTHLSLYLLRMSAKLMHHSEVHFEGRVVERSHMFAYYHAKAALFQNRRKLFGFIRHTTYTIGDSEESARSFVKFVENSMNEKRYKQQLEQYLIQVHPSSFVLCVCAIWIWQKKLTIRKHISKRLNT